MVRRNLNATMDPVIDRGMCCQWRPGYRPSAGYLAYERLLDLAISDALEDAGFDQTVVVQQIGEMRRMELYGPDSPGEFVMEWQPVERDGTPDSLEAMRQQMIRLRDWIEDCGQMCREMQGEP